MEMIGSVGTYGRFYFLGCFLLAIGISIVNPDHIASWFITMGIATGLYGMCRALDSKHDDTNENDSGRG